MKKFHKLPKTVKKTVRYILQDANAQNLTDIETQLLVAIQKKKEILQDK